MGCIRFLSVQNKPTVLTLFLRGEADTAEGCIVVFGNRLNKEAGIASRTFHSLQSVLNKHAEQEQEGWKNERDPGFVSLYTCHCQRQNWNKGKKDGDKYPSQLSDLSQASVYFLDGCLHRMALAQHRSSDAPASTVACCRPIDLPARHVFTDVPIYTYGFGVGPVFSQGCCSEKKALYCLCQSGLPPADIVLDPPPTPRV